EGTATALDLPKTVDVSIRRDGPENVRRIDSTQLRGSRQIFDTEFHSSTAPALSFYLCLTLEPGQHSRPTKLDRNRFVQRISYRNGLTFNVLLGNHNRCKNQTSTERKNEVSTNAVETHGKTTPDLRNWEQLAAVKKMLQTGALLP